MENGEYWTHFSYFRLVSIKNERTSDRNVRQYKSLKLPRQTAKGVII